MLYVLHGLGYHGIRFEHGLCCITGYVLNMVCVVLRDVLNMVCVVLRGTF